MNVKSMEMMEVVEFLVRRLNKEKIRFVFAGSISSLIQGCDIIPGDIDILVPLATDVHRIANIFGDFLIEQSIDINTPIESWLATHTTPVRNFVDSASNEWTFSRLIVNRIKLEIANIQPVNDQGYITGSGFWENGPHIWEHTIRIPFKDMEFPVIPLEIQLQTNMNRKLELRINEIIKIFRSKGYNKELINYALNQTNREKFQDYF